MKDKVIDVITKINAAVPVVWDRYTKASDDRYYVIYGWINRPDGLRDFLTVEMWETEWPENVFHTTSSAKYSELLSEILHGSLDDHNPCRKIEELFTVD